MRKILLYCIGLLWVVLIIANIVRLCGSSAFVAVLSAVPEMTRSTQACVNALLFFVELLFGLLLVTRGKTQQSLIIALVATVAAGFVQSPMENVYMNTVAYLIAITWCTNDPKPATVEFAILAGMYMLYGLLTQLGRFVLDSSNYMNTTVQILSCIDYKALPMLGFLYAKYYGKEKRLCLRSIGSRLAALSSLVTKMLPATTSPESSLLQKRRRK